MKHKWLNTRDESVEPSYIRQYFIDQVFDMPPMKPAAGTAFLLMQLHQFDPPTGWRRLYWRYLDLQDWVCDLHRRWCYE